MVATPKQFNGDLFVHHECAMNSLKIYTTLFVKEHLAKVIAIQTCIRSIISRGRHYTNSSCIEYALASFEYNLPSRHEPKSWSKPNQDWLDEYFKPRAKKRQINQNEREIITYL